MCGIIGQIETASQIDQAVFTTMRDTLTHRGPDDAGLYFNPSGKVALGHRRLSFLDLSEAGRQPMTNETGTLWLTFNGEIYNFPALREELITAGHTFKSTSDSEVILHGYEEWGPKIVEKLSGMFAFGLWDEDKQELLLARDRFGIKPLYYYQDTQRFLFSSELKGIVAQPNIEKKIDFSAMCDFLVYRYVPSPKTIWQHTKKIPPAHYLIRKSDGTVQLEQYWDLKPGDQKPADADAIREVDERLLASVKGHILSDVPIGSFLSGGYDSSAMVYYLNRLEYTPNTFAIGFGDWLESEHQYAEAVADQYGTEHHNVIIGGESLALVEKLATYYDEPLGDISIIPTYVVSWSAAQKVKAVLSGEGADEIFCGYSWQKAYMLNSGPEVDVVQHYAESMAMGWFDADLLKELFAPEYHEHIPEDVHWFYREHFNPELHPLQAIQYLDVKTFMGELVLTKVDRASMANSLEVRVPFLDPAIAKYVMSLSPEVYFAPKTQKYLLNKNLQGNLPDGILNRRKQGFVGPDRYYQDIRFYAKKLRNSYLVRDGILLQPRIEKMIEEEDHWRLWKVLVLEFWYRKWAA